MGWVVVVDGVGVWCSVFGLSSFCVRKVCLCDVCALAQKTLRIRIWAVTHYPVLCHAPHLPLFGYEVTMNALSWDYDGDFDFWGFLYCFGSFHEVFPNLWKHVME